jgi:spoIIIJ-associated protein
MDDQPDSSAPPAQPSTQDEARRLADFLSRFVEASPFEIHCHVTEEEERIRVELQGPDREMFLERRGEGLLSLQVLLGRVAAQEGISRPVFVDSGGFRQGREEEIAEIAILAAERVKKMKESQKLRPMDPYERRLVHIALKDDPDVETESEGEGFEKRVVIHPRPRNS